MDGSGIDHILIESNIISPGSIKGVLSGKNYNCATYSHKILFESLHRLLMEEFMKTQHEDVLCSIKNIVDTARGDLKKSVETDVVSSLANKYLDICALVRDGSLCLILIIYLYYFLLISQ